MELWQLGCKVRCRVSGISAFYLKLCVLPTPKQTAVIKTRSADCGERTRKMRSPKMRTHKMQTHKMRSLNMRTRKMRTPKKMIGKKSQR